MAQEAVAVLVEVAEDGRQALHGLRDALGDLARGAREVVEGLEFRLEVLGAQVVQLAPPRARLCADARVRLVLACAKPLGQASG